MTGITPSQVRPMNGRQMKGTPDNDESEMKSACPEMCSQSPPDIGLFTMASLRSEILLTFLLSSLIFAVMASDITETQFSVSSGG